MILFDTTVCFLLTCYCVLVGPFTQCFKKKEGKKKEVNEWTNEKTERKEKKFVGKSEINKIKQRMKKKEGWKTFPSFFLSFFLLFVRSFERKDGFLLLLPSFFLCPFSFNQKKKIVLFFDVLFWCFFSFFLPPPLFPSSFLLMHILL